MPATGATVELLLGGVWADITGDVYTRDAIQITRGRHDQGSRVDPGAASVTLNNKGGKYSPRNPASPLFGQIGRNTQVRISTDAGVRFVGEISSWPSRWDVSGGDVYVQVQAAGILRRLGQGATAFNSALRRSISRTSPLAYWPLEDGATATQAASGLVGGQPMRVVGVPPQFGATEGPPGSLSLPSFSSSGSANPTKAGGLTAPVAGGTTASWTIEALMQFPTTLPAGFASALGWTVTGSRANAWEIDAFPPDPGGGGLAIQWANTAFSDFGGPYYSNVTVTDGQWHHVRVTVAQSGSAISVQCWIDGTRVINTTEASVTLGAVRSVNANPGAATDAGMPSMGHLAVWSPSTTAGTYSAVDGYDGETAAQRISGITGEEDIDFVFPYSDDTFLVGPQTPDTLLTLLEAAADVDMGILYEDRESVALRYRPRTTLYNQDPALTLDYTKRGEVAPPLEPTEDDTGLTNDVTVSRPKGSSAQVTEDTGALSTLAPPDGVGTYPTSTTLAAHTDDQLANMAGWLLHLGTWDEARYPSVTVDLAAGPWLRDAAAAVDLGDLITIANPPPWLPPGDIDLMCQGYTEVISVFEWTITYTCSPYGPWQVGEVGLTARKPRAGTSGCVLGAAVAGGDTSLTLSTTSGPPWVDSATYPTDFPFDLLLGGGERVTVTAITGTTTTQTATVARAANGISRGWDSGVSVTLADPAYAAL